MELRIASGEGELAFFSTVTTFGTAVDITVAELLARSRQRVEDDRCEIVSGLDQRHTGKGGESGRYRVGSS